MKLLGNCFSYIFHRSVLLVGDRWPLFFHSFLPGSPAEKGAEHQRMVPGIATGMAIASAFTDVWSAVFPPKSRRARPGWRRGTRVTFDRVGQPRYGVKGIDMHCTKRSAP